MSIEKKSGEVVNYSEAVIKEYLSNMCYDLDMKWINVDDIISARVQDIMIIIVGYYFGSSNKKLSDKM